MTFNAKKLLGGADRSNTFKPVQISLDFHQAYEHTIIDLPCKLVNTNTSKVKPASQAQFFVHSVIQCTRNSAMVNDLLMPCSLWSKILPTYQSWIYETKVIVFCFNKRMFL